MKTNSVLWKPIGILGGMGPEATAELYKRIVNVCQFKYGAIKDSDFPEMFIYNLPLPDILGDEEDRDAIRELINAALRKLKGAGSDFIAVPCNTAFDYIDSSSTKLPVVNIIEEALRECKRLGVKTAGLISTGRTARRGLYSAFASGIEIRVLSEQPQERADNVILNVLAGRKVIEDREYLKALSTQFAKEGCDAVILGCTELPLLVSQEDMELRTIDTLQVLAERCVLKSRGDIS
ncbi:MAG: amino acid racemase [Candidatus Aenigmarchaeota archaeon]|nr:amino acid racemase [Candidatus Aenigmarchaeota archaeon]